jgi:hypothetical protein
MLSEVQVRLQARDAIHADLDHQAVSDFGYILYHTPNAATHTTLRTKPTNAAPVRLSRGNNAGMVDGLLAVQCTEYRRIRASTLATRIADSDA